MEHCNDLSISGLEKDNIMLDFLIGVFIHFILLMLWVELWEKKQVLQCTFC